MKARVSEASAPSKLGTHRKAHGWGEVVRWAVTWYVMVGEVASLAREDR